MSRHHFALFTGQMTVAAVDLINEALETAGIDATLTKYDDPASGPRGWFSGPNRGAPFDTALAEVTVDHLRSIGLWTDEEGERGPLPRQVRKKGRSGDRTWRHAGSTQAGSQ